MDDIELKYNEWCKSIAETKDADELISHFREHVYEHYKRYNNREDDISF